MDRVAARYGRPPNEVAGQPWVETLYWFAILVDSERIEGEVENLKHMNLAVRHAIAFHDPKRLWSERSRELAKLRLGPHRTSPEEQIARRVAHIEAVVAAHKDGNSDPIDS